MPTQSQVQETILTSQLKCADITNTNRLNSISGVGKVSWGLVRLIGLFISAVSNQYELGDFSSVGFLSCYDSLCKLVGSYGSGSIDTNAHGSGFIIDVTTGGFAPPIITQIIGGVTGNPITVQYTGFTNPTLIYRNADGSNYNGAVNNVDTGSAIILTGDSNDGVTFADSFEFVIKQ